MNEKYYVEYTDKPTVFMSNRPFETLEDAVKYVEETNRSAWIHKCKDNVLTLVMVRAYKWETVAK